MARWMLMLVLAPTAVSAASSSYTAYKTYLMTNLSKQPRRRNPEGKANSYRSAYDESVHLAI
jgi:hypothetical protein